MKADMTYKKLYKRWSINNNGMIMTFYVQAHEEKEINKTYINR